MNCNLYMTDDALSELLTLKCEVNWLGSRTYFNSNGLKHRIHGPAIISCDGSLHWYCNGLQHRCDDGPAYISGNRIIWYLHGVTHRECGPALTRSDGTCEYRKNGQIVRYDSVDEHIMREFKQHLEYREYILNRISYEPPVQHF